MRHWLLVGGVVILGTVVMFRSRVSNTSTVSPTAAPGVSVDKLPASYQPAPYRPSTMPTTVPTLGVPIDAHTLRITVPAAPNPAASPN